MPFVSGAHPLDAGTAFPPASFTTTDEKTVAVPGTAGGYAVVLLYRGGW
ncbi:MAG: hypothetical protein NVSMB19_10620 [Vulcanimicrobiaceae bacterium]